MQVMIQKNPPLKKIIGFDSWTIGAHHFTRLVPAFKRIGYELILIHIGSWGHDKDRPSTEFIGDLLVRDISFYGKKSFRQVLQQENPSAVLFLSTRAFAHQAFNRYAAELGIPTTHLYHGIVNVQVTEASQEKVGQLNWLRQLSLIKNRFTKNFFVLCPLYCKALIETSAPVTDWYYFIKELVTKITKGAIGKAPPDTKTNSGCVYISAEIPHMISHYGMASDNVHAVGNPDIAHFGLSQAMIGCCLEDRQNTSNQVMYIDTALVEAGMIFKDARDFVSHLISTKESLSAQGLNFCVKLHPAHFRSGVVGQLRANSIEICEDEDFIERLKSVIGVIVEPTTAAMLPALMGLPIFLGQYAKLSTLQYGALLIAYPRTRNLRNIADFSALIEQESADFDVIAVNEWCRANAGPMPAEQMPDRVAAVMNNMVRSVLNSKESGSTQNYEINK